MDTDMPARPPIGRRMLRSEPDGVAGSDAAVRPQPPRDPLAVALPDWDLLPATQFLRRR